MDRLFWDPTLLEDQDVYRILALLRQKPDLQKALEILSISAITPHQVVIEVELISISDLRALLLSSIAYHMQSGHCQACVGGCVLVGVLASICTHKCFACAAIMQCTTQSPWVCATKAEGCQTCLNQTICFSRSSRGSDW